MARIIEESVAPTAGHLLLDYLAVSGVALTAEQEDDILRILEVDDTGRLVALRGDEG